MVGPENIGTPFLLFASLITLPTKVHVADRNIGMGWKCWDVKSDIKETEGLTKY